MSRCPNSILNHKGTIISDVIDEEKIKKERRLTNAWNYQEKLYLLMFTYSGRWIEVDGSLVVKRNPPEFFDLVGKVLTMEEMNHPIATLKTALQQEELTPLMVIQLNNIKRWRGGTEISETNG